MTKKILAILLSLSLVLQLVSVTAFAGTGEQSESKLYKNLVVLGDSLCLGFSTKDASMTALDTFDIYSNVFRAANDHNSKVKKTGEGEYDLEAQVDEEHDYTHAYPTVLAKKLGIDTFTNNKVKYLFTQGDDYDDVYNFGICAAWAKDMYEILTDPNYVYTYYTKNYDNPSAEYSDYYAEKWFELPSAGTYYFPVILNGYYKDPNTQEETLYWHWAKDYIQLCKAENMPVKEFNPNDITTWEFAKVPNMEYSDKLQLQYSYWGYDFYKKDAEVWAECINEPTWTVNYKKFFADKCLNQLYSYGGTLIPILWANSSVQMKEGDKVPADIAAEYLGFYYDSKFTRYYYNFITDKVKNADLLLLAIGGNDIYHTFMDKYMMEGAGINEYYQQTGKGNPLGLVLFMISYALQSGMTVGDIITQLPTYSSMLQTNNQVPFAAANMAASPLSALSVVNNVASPDAVEQAIAQSNDNIATANGVTDEETGTTSFLKGILTTENIEWLLDYYSSEKVTEYMKTAVADYKSYYEKTIQALLGTNGKGYDKDDGALMESNDSQLVLIGHFNPFGMKNYVKMMTLSMINGELNSHLRSSSSVIARMMPTAAKLARQKLTSLSDKNFEALIKEFTNVLDNIGEYVEELGDEELTQLIVDLSFPMTVLLMNDALNETYAQFNGFVEEMAEKYNVKWIDVSDAPASGVFDPHPTENGHEWIANKIYDEITPTITTKVNNILKLKGSITPSVTTRLGSEVKITITKKLSSGIRNVYIDGVALTEEELAKVKETGTYTFENVLDDHKITVTFK